MKRGLLIAGLLTLPASSTIGFDGPPPNFVDRSPRMEEATTHTIIGRIDRYETMPSESDDGDSRVMKPYRAIVRVERRERGDNLAVGKTIAIDFHSPYSLDELNSQRFGVTGGCWVGDYGAMPIPGDPARIYTKLGTTPGTWVADHPSSFYGLLYEGETLRSLNETVGLRKPGRLVLDWESYRMAENQRQALSDVVKLFGYGLGIGLLLGIPWALKCFLDWREIRRLKKRFGHERPGEMV